MRMCMSVRASSSNATGVRIVAVGIETIHRSRRVPRSYETREWRWLGPIEEVDCLRRRAQALAAFN